MLNKKDWEDIIYKDRKIDEEQVMKKLGDYAFIMSEVSEVYEYMVGLSKINYFAKTIIGLVDERWESKDITKSDVIDIIEDCDNLEGIKEELKNYFKIK